MIDRKDVHNSAMLKPDMTKGKAKIVPFGTPAPEPHPRRKKKARKIDVKQEG